MGCGSRLGVSRVFYGEVYAVDKDIFLELAKRARITVLLYLGKRG